jgi:hypothetical protein
MAQKTKQKNQCDREFLRRALESTANSPSEDTNKHFNNTLHVFNRKL